MSVVANRDDVISIGSYKNELEFYDDNNHQTISIDGDTGQTIVTVTLNYGSKSVTRTIYLNVYL